ncbi:MAG TPA: DMT family transporter [Thermoplasmata archaeon]|jgi:drug/metabolite transporter (DMT)-like permease
MDSRRRDYFLVILSSVFWGTSFPGSKLVIGAVDPLFLTMARLGLGAALGFAVLLALRRLDLRVFRDPFVWGLGALNAIAFDLQNVGISITTASKTALLVNVNIVFIAILMAVFYRERVTVNRVGGIVLGLFGVIVLATRLDPAALQGGEFLGDGLVFLSGVVWAFYIVGTKARVDRGGDFIAWTTGVLAVTAVVAALPVLIFRVPVPVGGLSWTGILYLGLVPTFIPILLYTYSMRTISPTISSLLILLEVVIAALLSFLFLADPIDAFTLGGGALILFGAYIVSRGEKEIPEPGAAGLAPVPVDTADPEPAGFARR